MYCSLPERLTAIRGTNNVRHTSADAARLGDTTSRGSLSPESKPDPLRVLILSHVEAFPEADGLLSG
jgi:hypothetical protein